ncbi:MAG: iron export ABC transporter permease subunit FetB [Actinobacteria bacterium]|nr:iron export ABC transporter permease subunit FetB [Actinomycetota bacterium]MBI3688789.1 iron export ABC transporter permease subunit FetB [Actinomycetota bacterium]
MSGDVTWVGLLASLLLVSVAVVVSWRIGLRLETTIVWATVRAVAQLLLAGWALTVIIDPGRPLAWSWLWVVTMTGYAGVVVRRRAPEIPQVMLLAVTAFAVSAVVTLGVLFGLRVFPLEGRTLVPLAGLMIGNAMNATVLAGRRIVEQLRDQREEVEARLALGQTSQQAARPYLVMAVRTALVPQIETTRAVGLVILPGAMTGLILAGVKPLDAVLVQAVVMFVVLGSVATTAAVIGVGLTHRLFTRDHRLRAIPRPAQR